MIYKYITNNPEVASFVENAGVKEIFLDLEKVGKAERQQGRDTFLSTHVISDITKVKKSINTANLLVRTDSINFLERETIEQIIDNGADILMLPMVKSHVDVEQLLNMVRGRIKISLLLETSSSIVNLDRILEHSNDISEVYLGLNDMHISMGLDFMFQLLSGDIVELMTRKISKTGIRYGFGGIGRIGEGIINPELVMSEHIRLGSESVILSRAFRGNTSSLESLKAAMNFEEELRKLNNVFCNMKGESELTFHERKLKLRSVVDNFVLQR